MAAVVGALLIFSSALRSELRRLQGPWVDIAERVQAITGDDRPLWRYPLLLASERLRDRLFQDLWRAGLGPSRMYRRPVAELAQVGGRVTGGEAPMARDFAQRLLTLPLHTDVRSDDYAAVAAVLQRFAAARAATAPVNAMSV